MYVLHPILRVVNRVQLVHIRGNNRVALVLYTLLKVVIELHYYCICY